VILLLSPLAHAAEAHVAVAANFMATTKKLQGRFEASSGHSLIVSSGSSGKLYALIRSGAPYDIFLSAEADFTQRLIDEGFAEPGDRYVYALGRLVLWMPESRDAVSESSVSKPFTGYLAVANPRLAPYGQAAKKVLQRLGVWDTYRQQIVMGENVAQTFQFVSTGNAVMGFVALSQVLDYQVAARQYWQVPQSQHDPIRQSALLLKRGRDNAAARAFFRFLQSGEARKIIVQSGYGIVE
jgi:molybdate transport system substrate-binding protein